MPLAAALDLVLAQDLLLLFLRAALHRQLVEIGEELVLVALYSTVVAYCDACLVVAEDAVVLDLREAGAGADDATPLVLVDLVVGDMVAAVVEDDAVAVVKGNDLWVVIESGG